MENDPSAPAAPPRLIGVLASGQKVECAVDRPEVDIGSAPHNRLVIGDATVSKTHAMVIARGGVYSIVDLGSRNGTFVNGERVGESAWPLRHGDKIKLGQAVLIFRDPEGSTESRTAQLPAGTVRELRDRLAAEAAAAVAPATASEPPEGPALDDERDEKKRRKRKKEEERIRAAYINSVSRIVATVLSVALTAGLTVFLVRSTQSRPAPPAPAPDPAPARDPVAPLLRVASAAMPFRGATIEASGAASRAGTGDVLVVDDDSPSELLWLRVGPGGEQAGDARRIPLGASVADPEAITYGASYFYVVGSASRARPAAGTYDLVRFAFDPAAGAVSRAPEGLRGLRELLLSAVPELRAEGARDGREGGISIEGLAFDPRRERLLLGLRSPLVGGDAVIVPLAVKDPLAPLEAGNVQVEPAIRLPLSGGGIRDLHHDPRLASLLVVSGAPEHLPGAEFRLWSWSGEAGARPQEHAVLDAGMKPEGITHVAVDGREFVLLVGDAGRYLRLDYPSAR